MTITIGDQTLAIRTPKDLDDRLLAATGCNAAEHAAMLAGTPMASHLAKALHPFIHVEEGEPPHVSELAVMIAGADLGEVRPQVLALYARNADEAQA